MSSRFLQPVHLLLVATMRIVTIYDGDVRNRQDCDTSDEDLPELHLRHCDSDHSLCIIKYTGRTLLSSL